MTALDSQEIRIRAVPPEAWAEAARLVFRTHPDDVRTRQLAATLDQFQAEPSAAAGLLEARMGDATVGAIWIQIQAGQVASLWPPQAVLGSDSNSDAIAKKLLAAATELAVRGHCRMIQALLRTDTGSDARQLKEAAFEHIADLLYLVSPAAGFPTAAPSNELTFENFSTATTARFEAIVERTYRGTQDCPRLDGVRPIGDVLEGYQAVGRFDPANWLLVQRGADDVGCLILADHGEHELWELVYMGIVPEARGQGLGLAVTRYAQWLARQSGVERLVLAVDAANRPAIQGYVQAGFVAWDRRSVFFKRLS